MFFFNVVIIFLLSLPSSLFPALQSEVRVEAKVAEQVKAKRQVDVERQVKSAEQVKIVEQVKGNELHDMIEKYEFLDESWEAIKENVSEKIKQSVGHQFSELIAKYPKLVLEADANGFLPIDLLILKIKKLGEDSRFGCDKNTSAVRGQRLCNLLLALSQAMVKQGFKLHGKEGIKIVEKGNSERTHVLSSLGFLLSPFNLKGYTPQSSRELHGPVAQTLGLSPLELNAFFTLWHDDQIKSSIDLQGVTCISNMGLDQKKVYPFTTLTPLHVAVQCSNDDNIKLVDAILSKPNVEINALDGSGYTPLMRAIGAAHNPATDPVSDPDKKVVKLLVKYPGIDLNSSCKASSSAVVNKTPLEIVSAFDFNEEADKMQIMQMLSGKKIEQTTHALNENAKGETTNRSILSNPVVTAGLGVVTGATLFLLGTEFFKKKGEGKVQEVFVDLENNRDDAFTSVV